MLSEIAIEVLHFLARRDLDKASGVNKWLDALIANYCEGYPLRVVHRVYMSRYKKGVSVTVMEDLFSGTDYSFSTGSMCEALHFAGTVLRHSYVKHGFQVGYNLAILTYKRLCFTGSVLFLTSRIQKRYLLCLI